MHFGIDNNLSGSSLPLFKGANSFVIDDWNYTNISDDRTVGQNILKKSRVNLQNRDVAKKHCELEINHIQLCGDKTAESISLLLEASRVETEHVTAHFKFTTSIALSSAVDVKMVYFYIQFNCENNFYDKSNSEFFPFVWMKKLFFNVVIR